MRRIGYADVANAARAVMAADPHLRESLCATLLREAEVADAHRLETGMAHPLWGTGSLMEVARQRRQVAEPGFDDRDYCAALRLVLAHLMQHALNRKHS